MTTRFLRLGLLVSASIVAVGCTTRYSQSLTGTIPRANGTEVRSSDTGFSLFGIALDEPRSAHEQVLSLLGPCSSLTKVWVDYRELTFIILGIPKVTVSGTCVQ